MGMELMLLRGVQPIDYWLLTDDRLALARLLPGLVAAPNRPKKTRVRHSDPEPGPLRPLPLGRRKGFSAAALKRLTDWPWAEKKTRTLIKEAVLRREAGVDVMHHAETRTKQANTHRRISEDLAYRIMMRERERETE
jgi:hypothetical protein